MNLNRIMPAEGSHSKSRLKIQAALLLDRPGALRFDAIETIDFIEEET